MATWVKLTATASLRGTIKYARGSSKPVYAFLGVPFAQPPVGKLRFQAPQPLQWWLGEKSATEFGPICPQNWEATAKSYNPYPVPTRMSEDCLYLNVWTPSVDEQKKLPVMVWIYGGAFFMGFSDFYDGTAFAARQDVIFVSLNYRVGPLGFLSTGDEAAPGNAGLLDQVAALRWVKANISKFGGDPENITVFGESAGAISTSLHLCSPLARGLFRRAICQSGVAVHPGAVWKPQNARKYLMKQVKSIGFEGTDLKEVLAFLQSKPAKEIIEGLGVGFSPVLDGTYLSVDPERALCTNQWPPVDLLLGFTANEGYQFIKDLTRQRKTVGPETMQALIDFIFRRAFYRGVPRVEDIIKVVYESYFKDIDKVDGETLTKTLCEMYGDLLFMAPSILVAAIHSGSAPTFMYELHHRLSISPLPAWVVTDHGQDVPLTVGEPFLQRMPDVWNDDDRRASDLLMSYWANFARTGDPNGDGLPLWPRYDSTSEKYLVLGARPQTAARYRPDRMSIWNRTIAALIASGSTQAKY